MATPVLVQHAQNLASSSTTCTVTLTGTGSGNSLIVAITSDTSISSVKLGGSAGNFTARVTSSSNIGATAYIYEDWNIAASQTSLVVTLSASGNCAVDVYEVSGLVSTGAYDKSNSATGSASSWASGLTGTLSQSSEFVCGVTSSYSVTPTGPGSPWINEASQFWSFFHGLSGYNIVSATTSLQYGGTTGGNWIAAVASFKAAAGTSGSVNLTAPNVQLAAPLLSFAYGGSVALTAPNVQLAAPLLSFTHGGSVALTTPSVALAAPLLSFTHGGSAALTTPSVQLAAPLLSFAYDNTVHLTTPNVALAAPVLAPLVTVGPALTTPNLALAAPVLAFSYGGSVNLTAPNVQLAAPLLSIHYGSTVYLTTPNLALAAPLLTIVVTRVLTFSIAPKSGTDRYGNAYQAGITFFGSGGNGYILNQAGVFSYHGTPALGTLIASITPESYSQGSDIFGNTYVGGVASYVLSGSTYYCCALAGGVMYFLQATSAGGTYTATGSIDWINGNLAIGSTGTVTITSGGGSASTGKPMLCSGTFTGPISGQLQQPSQYPISNSGSSGQLLATTDALNELISYLIADGYMQ